MTKHEISILLDLPITTLDRWSNEDDRKNKLFKLLENINKDEAKKIITKKPTHRIFHILNRNITLQNKYSFDEIRKAFLNNDYTKSTLREKIIYSKFFKECDTDDLISFEKVFKVSRRNIKIIYSQIPERKFKGVAKIWDRRFRLKHIEVTVDKTNQKNIPLALQKILNKRIASV